MIMVWFDENNDDIANNNPDNRIADCDTENIFTSLNTSFSRNNVKTKWA